MMAAPLNVLACPLAGISLIEASAGTGKTWNICALYLRCLLERRLPVQQILVVTFTNAATAELRERIRAQIVMALAVLRKQCLTEQPLIAALLASAAAQEGNTPTALEARLETAARFFDEAAVFTIHGFCQRALADAPLATGSAYELELIEDDEKIRHEVVADFWRRHFDLEQFDVLLATYFDLQQDTPQRWAEVLRTVLGRPLSKQIWPSDLDNLWAEQGPIESSGQTRANQLLTLRARTKAQWEDSRESVVACLLAYLPNLPGNRFKPKTIETALRAWDDYFAQASPLMSTVALDRARIITWNYLDANRKKQSNPPPENSCLHAIEKLLLQLESLDRRLGTERLWWLRKMVTEAGETVRAAKRTERVASYDDVLYNAWYALCSGARPALAKTLRVRYPVALVDEFQDTDPLQSAIFAAIYAATRQSPPIQQAFGADGENSPDNTASEHSEHSPDKLGTSDQAHSSNDEDWGCALFLVGDPKQAIYGFRNADLQAYLRAKKNAARIYSLDQNQRSVEGLIQANNALFSRNPDAFILPGLSYRNVHLGAKPRVRLVEEHGSIQGATDATMRIWQLPLAADGEPVTRRLANQLAAKATATEIVRLLAGAAAKAIRIAERPLLASDIAVLVRNHRQGRLVQNALTELGIASVTQSPDSLFQSSEFAQLEQILQAIEQSPLRTLGHRAIQRALATDLMGWSAHDLLTLTLNPELAEHWTARFRQYHRDWQDKGFAFLFRRWLDQEKVVERMLKKPLGDRILTNLLHAAELLQSASVQAQSTDSLLHWIKSRRTNPQSIEEAQLRLESDRNLVQIMTIHRSKGLEFGIVFCPFLWDAWPQRERSTLPCEYYDSFSENVLDFRPEAPESDAIKHSRRAESEAEQIRLIYVVMTRAVHRCYLVAGCYHAGSAKSGSIKQSSQGMLNWLAFAPAPSPDRGDTTTRSTNTYRDWGQSTKTLQEIEGAWESLRQRAATYVTIETLALVPTAGSIFAAPPSRTYLARPAPAIPVSWKTGSFSSLARVSADKTTADGPQNELREAAAALDHDQANAAQTQAQALAQARTGDADLTLNAAVQDILRFPRGASAGECIHHVLEHIDFTNPHTWPACVNAALERFPQVLGGKGDAAMQLLSMIEDLVSTVLVAGITLRSITPTQRLNELEFDLPAPALPSGQLRELLLDAPPATTMHGNARFDPVPSSLQGAPTQGGFRGAPSHGSVPSESMRGGVLGEPIRYLKGFIDLVFEYSGQFYVVDWKSNFLGVAPQDYSRPQLDRCMTENDYVLQAKIYSLALHRLLRSRLPNYQFESHFGGVLYLFVRGVRPRWQDAQQQPCGVWFDRPSAQAIQALDQHLRAPLL